MQKCTLLAFGFSIALLVCLQNDSVGQQSYRRSSYRPCGPENLPTALKRFFRQGAGGGDFRSACQRHDDCYDLYGSRRADCDRRFYQGMLDSCSSARNPALCRFHASRMYRIADTFGEKWYREGQIYGQQMLLNQR